MDFNLNDEQELFVAGIRELMASENWEAYFAECDRDSVYPERFVKALADMGIDSLLIPEEHGGLDAGFVTLAAVWMELGRLGAPTYVLYQLPGGFNTFLREGTQEQIDKIMAFRGTGKQMWNSAITEPSAGSDVGSLKTTYTRRNGKIYLNGSKCFITSSAYTPYIVVMARDGASPDKPVYTEWFVDMSKPGIKVTKLEKLGLRMDSCCEITFDDVELDEKYSARAFWGQVQKYRATITECIPMMIRTLMVQPPSANDRQHRLREVMFYLNLSEQEKDAFCERFGVRLLTSYGMTETIVGIIGDRPGDKRRWPSIGRAGFCYEAEIRDDHNCPLPAGEIGEICIKGVPGKTIFKEYFLNPKATAKVLEADGWLHTGDTGYCDEEGFFYFVDRRCNMIKRGGENVSCVELENIIATHPKIQDIVVVGIKDSIRDEAIKAFVVLNEGETLSEEEFFRFCEQNMAKFKVPSYLEIRKDLPRNCSGKIIRKNLK